MTTDLIEHLEGLLRHPGWLWLQAEARREWEHPFAQTLAAISDRDDTMALNKLRQIQAAKAAVETLLAKPEAKLRQLREAEMQRGPQSDYSRRGTL